MEVINYKNSIINISNSILKYFNILPYHETLKDIDKLLTAKKYQNVVVLLCDGLGSKNLKDCLSNKDFLRKKKVKDIMSVFPPTTTSATTSFLTGLTPSEHHWYGWDMYFQDSNETISLFLNKVKGTKKKPILDVLKRDYMQYETIIDLINKKTNKKAYYLSPFSIENPCDTLESVLENILKLSKEKGQKFIYGYIENPDKLMHHYGIYSKKVQQEVKKINDKLEILSQKLKDTVIFVIADHGLISTKYINLKKDIPSLYDMLLRTTAIESRACGIKLKDNVKKEDFEKLFNTYLQDKFTLLTYEQVLKLQLFGDKENSYLKDTIGDYLLVATSNFSINYDDTSPTFKANHAGYTKDELLVPLIVIDCK